MARLRLFFALSLSLFFLIQTVSALSVLNIYVDSSGTALILGETDLSEGLPTNIQISDMGEVTGSTSALTSKNGEVWTFSLDLPETDMTVFLPPTATITSISGGEISLSGSRIAVYASDALQVTYVLGSGELAVEPFPLALLGWILVGAVALIALVFLLNWFNRENKIRLPKLRPHPVHQHKAAHDKIESLRGVLNEREQQIVDELKSLGKVKSSYLRRTVDIPKASFSRHIQELERKGIIKRTGEGRNKFVELIR